MGVFRPYLTILSPVQQRLWPLLRPASTLGLVLYGGTAIALRFGHRPSVDFDFFTEKPLDKGVLTAAFPFIARATVLQESPDGYPLKPGQRRVRSTHYMPTCLWCVKRTLLPNCLALSG